MPAKLPWRTSVGVKLTRNSLTASSERILPPALVTAERLEPDGPNGDGIRPADLEALDQVLAIASRSHRRSKAAAPIRDLHRGLGNRLALRIRHLPRDRAGGHALGGCLAHEEHCKSSRGHEGA